MFGSLSREPSRESVGAVGTTDEELAVLLHASQLGRTDIVQQAISSLKTILDDDLEVIKLISASRIYQIDENTSGTGTALHVASKHGHSDVGFPQRNKHGDGHQDRNTNHDVVGGQSGMNICVTSTPNGTRFGK